MATQVILLERVENLGAMGDVVSVKPGYARNYLLPKAKALRATKENIAYYEVQKESLKKANAEKKAQAEKLSKTIEGAKVVLIRQASEGGQLYGSVSSRDIAEALCETTKQEISRGMVVLNQNVKTIGLFDVNVVLHAEVRVKISVNVARTSDEAIVQEKTGKAVVAETQNTRGKSSDATADKTSMLEDSALANEAAEEEHEAQIAAESAEKAAKKASKRSSKKAEESSADESTEA